MPDSRPDSSTYANALAFEFPRQPRITKAGRVWVCESDGLLAAGVGRTMEDAYVDHVEEYWCLTGCFPPGYPL